MKANRTRTKQETGKLSYLTPSRDFLSIYLFPGSNKTEEAYVLVMLNAASFSHRLRKQKTSLTSCYIRIKYIASKSIRHLSLTPLQPFPVLTASCVNLKLLGTYFSLTYFVFTLFLGYILSPFEILKISNNIF
jgi:hypothetical protein